MAKNKNKIKVNHKSKPKWTWKQWTLVIIAGLMVFTTIFAVLGEFIVQTGW